MTAWIRRQGLASGLLAGLILGLLLAIAVIPRRQPTSTIRIPASSEAAPNGSGRNGAAGGGTGIPDNPGSATSPGLGTAGEAKLVAPPGRSGPSPLPNTGQGPSRAGLGRGPSQAPSALGPGSEPPAGAARGVTSTSVTIGIAALDLSAVAVLGPEYDNGDVVGQWKALVADWHERHLLPVNGRDVVLRFAKYGVTNFDEQRKACATLVDDDHAFAVVGIEFFYQEGADCVAREKRTPLLTSEGPTDEVFARSAPYLFSLQMSQSRLLRNFVLWAESRHALRGRRVGLYYFNDPNVADLMHRTIGAQLAALGYPPPVEMTTNDRLGGPEDALAVQRFRASKVDVAILFTSQAGFTQQAAGQGYHPTYLATDYEGATSDVGTNLYNGPEFDGTFGMTTLRRGEPAAGVPPTAEEEACVTNYERRAGHHVARPGQAGHETAEWVFIVLSCDEGKVLLQALRSGGRALSTTSFLVGLETVREMPLIRYPNVTFGPDRHQGVAQQRPLRWHADCTCWRALGRFDPLFTS